LKMWGRATGLQSVQQSACISHRSHWLL